MKINHIYFQDFGSLESELLRIDYIRWNLVPLKPYQINKAASYFKTLGFNSYQKDRENSRSREELRFDIRNLYEVVFILKINYQKGTHIEFSRASAHRIFDLIKQEHLQWQKLLQHKATLCRIDICYDRKPKSTNRISNCRFINDSLQQFQDSHPNQNLSFDKNQKGLLVKFGNRQSDRYYHVYNKNNILRFEFEFKDKKNSIITIFYYRNLSPKSWKESYLISFLNTHFKYLALLSNPIILTGYFIDYGPINLEIA